ncbi:MAG: DegT/DnrJ/EryC1/StrS family aminotransferase [Puniceicoccaceae bacterium]
MARLYLSPPDVGPAGREALLRAFDSGWVAPAGPEIPAFESDLARFLAGSGSGSGSAVHCAALSSGTAALHLALVLAGVGPGDRVLVSGFTFAATANAVHYCGAEPVFLDSDERTWNLDPARLAEVLRKDRTAGRLPKAVVAVDLYGQCADYGRIVPLCREHGVTLIQDAAEALGAVFDPAGAGGGFGERAPAGLQGDFGVFSFNGNKILTTGGGGMLVSRDAGTIERARFLATQARENAPHYEHRQVGYNYRMGNLPAAMGRAQLDGLPGKIAARKRTFAFYRRRFGDRPGLGWIPFGATGEPNYWLSCLTLDPGRIGFSREDFRLALAEEDIEARPLWKPMHLQPAWRHCECHGGAVGGRLFAQGLCLPSGSGLTDEDRERVGAVWDRLAGGG